LFEEGISREKNRITQDVQEMSVLQKGDKKYLKIKINNEERFFPIIGDKDIELKHKDFGGFVLEIKNKESKFIEQEDLSKIKDEFGRSNKQIYDGLIKFNLDSDKKIRSIKYTITEKAEILELKTNRFLPSDKVSLGKYEKSIFEEPKVGLPGEQTEKKEPVRRYFPDKKLRNIALGKEKEPSMNEADDLYLYQIRADLRNAAFGDFQPNKEYFTEEEWRYVREQRNKILEEYKHRYEENKDLSALYWVATFAENNYYNSIPGWDREEDKKYALWAYNQIIDYQLENPRGKYISDIHGAVKAQKRLTVWKTGEDTYGRNSEAFNEALKRIIERIEGQGYIIESSTPRVDGGWPDRWWPGGAKLRIVRTPKEGKIALKKNDDYNFGLNPLITPHQEDTGKTSLEITPTNIDIPTGVFSLLKSNVEMLSQSNGLEETSKFPQTYPATNYNFYDEEYKNKPIAILNIDELLKTSNPDIYELFTLKFKDPLLLNDGRKVKLIGMERHEGNTVKLNVYIMDGNEQGMDITVRDITDIKKYFVVK